MRSRTNLKPLLAMALVAGVLILSLPDRVVDNDALVEQQGVMKGHPDETGLRGGGGKDGGGTMWGYKAEMDDDHDDDDASGMAPFVVSEPPPGSQPGYVGTLRSTDGPTATPEPSVPAAVSPSVNQPGNEDRDVPDEQPSESKAEELTVGSNQDSSRPSGLKSDPSTNSGTSTPSGSQQQGAGAEEDEEENPLLARAGPSPCMFKGVLLVVGFSHKAHQDILDRLHSLYSGFFPHIVATGDVHKGDSDLPHLSLLPCSMNRGSFGHVCLASSITEFPNYDGYLYMDAGGLLFPWALSHLDRSVAWTGEYNPHDIPEKPHGSLLSFQLFNLNKCKTRHNIAVWLTQERHHFAMAGPSEFVYLPKALAGRVAARIYRFHTCLVPASVGLPSAIAQVLAEGDYSEPLVVQGFHPTSKDLDKWFDSYEESTEWVYPAGSTPETVDSLSAVFRQHRRDSTCGDGDDGGGDSSNNNSGRR